MVCENRKSIQLTKCNCRFPAFGLKLYNLCDHRGPVGSERKLFRLVKRHVQDMCMFSLVSWLSHARVAYTAHQAFTDRTLS